MILYPLIEEYRLFLRSFAFKLPHCIKYDRGDIFRPSSNYFKKQENKLQDMKVGRNGDVIQLFRACPVRAVSACGAQYYSATDDACCESHLETDFHGGADSPWDR